MIDNSVPTPPSRHRPRQVPVGTCGIVTTAPDMFRFEIVAATRSSTC